MPSKPSLIIPLLLALGFVSQASETVHYATDFSEFESGDDTLVGNDGWRSSHPNQGLHGTIDDVFEDGNRSGTIGYNIPQGDSNVVTLWRPINVDPAANGSLITFSVDVAVIDSDNNAYDSFYVSIFNQEDQILASVVFDNTEEAFGLWRYDGDAFHDLSISFDHVRVYPLTLTIDFANNQWSADLGDNLVLFEDAPFTVSSAVKNFGDAAVEWEVADLEDPGTNWLYFDNWIVTEKGVTTPNPEPDGLTVPTIRRMPNGRVRLTWEATPGETFVVERSPDLVNWSADGPNSEVVAEDDGSARYVDGMANTVDVRFYRVRRP